MYIYIHYIDILYTHKGTWYFPFKESDIPKYLRNYIKNIIFPFKNPEFPVISLFLANMNTNLNTCSPKRKTSSNLVPVVGPTWSVSPWPPLAVSASHRDAQPTSPSLPQRRSFRCEDEDCHLRETTKWIISGRHQSLFFQGQTAYIHAQKHNVHSWNLCFPIGWFLRFF